ncbi:unnamed protein product, partial [Polarella glacialis]
DTGLGYLSSAQTRQQYGQDVVLHRDQFADLNISDAVHFRVALNIKGQPVARGVRKATGDAPPPAGPGNPPPPPPEEPSSKARGSRSRSRSNSASPGDRRKKSRSRSRDRRRRR